MAIVISEGSCPAVALRWSQLCKLGLPRGTVQCRERRQPVEELVGQHVPTWPFSLKQCLPSEIASQQQQLRLRIIRNVLASPPPQTS